MANILSFAPDDMIQGGLLNDITAKVKAAKFDKYTYPNTSVDTLAALITLETPEGEVYEDEPYSVGDPEKFQATDKGKSVMSVTGAAGLPKGSKYARLMAAFVEHGVPVELLKTGNISNLVGITCFWQRRIDPEMPGRTKTQAQIDKEQKYGPPSTLLPVKLLGMPGEKVKAGAGKAGAGKAPATTAAAPAGDASEGAKAYILTMLGEADGTITRKKLNSLAYSKLAKDPQKNDIIKLLADSSFIESLAEDGVAVDGDSLVLVG